MAKKKRSRRWKNAGELPQAAPLASDSDDELDDDDVAFVSAHASYARGIANLAVDAIRAGKKRKTRPSGGEDDENRTTAYEREHVASRRRAEEEEEDAKKKKKKKKEDEYDSDDSFIASESDEDEAIGAVREARRVAGEFGAGGSAARKARIAAASAPKVSFGFSAPTSSAAPTILVPRRKNS